MAACWIWPSLRFCMGWSGFLIPADLARDGFATRASFVASLLQVPWPTLGQDGAIQLAV
ncbi:hypothetical protein IMZ48_31585 [Candidatus Bathyarchaeota archaeon]|nr:hypothetical protein [Candidatus Bathyarchaeota archaeon]